MANILVSFDAGVAKVLINRPNKKNSLTGNMYKTMDAAFKEALNREDIKVLNSLSFRPCTKFYNSTFP